MINVKEITEYKTYKRSIVPEPRLRENFGLSGRFAAWVTRLPVPGRSADPATSE